MLPVFKQQKTEYFPFIPLMLDARRPSSRLIIPKNTMHTKHTAKPKTAQRQFRNSISAFDIKAIKRKMEIVLISEIHQTLVKKNTSTPCTHWKYQYSKRPSKIYKENEDVLLIKGTNAIKEKPINYKTIIPRDGLKTAYPSSVNIKFTRFANQKAPSTITSSPLAKCFEIKKSFGSNVIFKRPGRGSCSLAFKMEDLQKESPIKMSSLLRNESGSKIKKDTLETGILRPMTNVNYRI